MVYSKDRPETDEARRATQERYRHPVQYMIGNPPLWKREIVLRFLNQLYGYRFSQTKITQQDGQPRHMMSHHIMKIGEHALDRKRALSGKRVTVPVNLRGRGTIKKKQT